MPIETGAKKMSEIILTKENVRTSRPACKRCGSAGNEGFYWATSSATQRLVMMERTDVTIDAAKGASLPLSDVHPCFKRDAGITGDSVPAPAPSGDQETPAPAPAPTPAPDAPAPYVRGENPLADAIRDIVGPVQIDRAEVESIAREIVGKVVFPTQTVVIQDGETRTVPGLAHERLPRVIAALSAGDNVMLVGPAGTGKSHIGKQAAKDALGVEFYTLSLTGQTGESKLTGFVDANGTFHGTVVTDWAMNPDGGLLCFDEIDNGNPNILGWMNAVLANRYMTINGVRWDLTDKHYFVGTANTYGFGRTREYVGRNPIDAATRNRFAMITIGIDAALETALVHGTGVKADTAEKILTYVRKIRSNADAKGVNVVMSPRNSVGMARLLAAGYHDWDMAVEDRIQCGIDEITWGKITA